MLKEYPKQPLEDFKPPMHLIDERKREKHIDESRAERITLRATLIVHVLLITCCCVTINS